MFSTIHLIFFSIIGYGELEMGKITIMKYNWKRLNAVLNYSTAFSILCNILGLLGDGDIYSVNLFLAISVNLEL